MPITIASSVGVVPRHSFIAKRGNCVSTSAQPFFGVTVIRQRIAGSPGFARKVATAFSTASPASSHVSSIPSATARTAYRFAWLARMIAFSVNAPALHASTCQSGESTLRGDTNS